MGLGLCGLNFPPFQERASFLTRMPGLGAEREEGGVSLISCQQTSENGGRPFFTILGVHCPMVCAYLCLFLLSDYFLSFFNIRTLPITLAYFPLYLFMAISRFFYQNIMFYSLIKVLFSLLAQLSPHCPILYRLFHLSFPNYSSFRKKFKYPLKSPCNCLRPLSISMRNFISNSPKQVMVKLFNNLFDFKLFINLYQQFSTNVLQEAHECHNNF